MKIVDRYVLSELLVPFFASILIFTTIIVGSTVLFQLIGDAVKYQIPVGHVLQLVIFKLPVIVALSLPMSVLFSTLIVFGRMGNDLEILAFRANGVNVLRLVIPVIVFGFLISLVALGFSDYIVPKSATQARLLFISYRDKNRPTIKQNINFTQYDIHDLPKRILNVAQVEGQQLKNITVAEYENGELSRIIRAKSGQWIPNGGWEFYDGIMHTFEKNDFKRVTVIEYKKEYMDIQLNPFYMLDQDKDKEEWTRKELRQAIEIKKMSGEDPIKEIMDYHVKLALGFASLIYAILGVSIGIRPHRSSSAKGLGISLVVIISYVVLLSVGMGLGLTHTLPAIVAAWFPNIVTGIAGILLLQRAIRQ